MLKENDIANVKATSEEVHMEPNDVAELITKLREAANRCPKGLRFEDPSIHTEQDYWNLTGISKADFEDLYQTVKNKLGPEKGLGK